VNNPLHILRTLDRHLHSRFELCVYGRSALALGFRDIPARFEATLDVDAILPSKDILALEQNDDFWEAQQRTNAELGDRGLYFTHLFEDKQVILTPDWLERLVALTEFEFRHLCLFRPSTADLVLTKMMRVDPDDRNDIEFLLRQSDLTPEALRSSLARAVIPPVPEIAEAFARNRAWLLTLGAV
jgi:hypothetical protein